MTPSRLAAVTCAVRAGGLRLRPGVAPDALSLADGGAAVRTDPTPAPALAVAPRPVLRPRPATRAEDCPGRGAAVAAAHRCGGTPGPGARRRDDPAGAGRPGDRRGLRGHRSPGPARAEAAPRRRHRVLRQRHLTRPDHPRQPHAHRPGPPSAAGRRRPGGRRRRPGARHRHPVPGVHVGRGRRRHRADPGRRDGQRQGAARHGLRRGLRPRRRRHARALGPDHRRAQRRAPDRAWSPGR